MIRRTAERVGPAAFDQEVDQACPVGPACSQLRRPPRSRRGSAAVEFAVVAPIFLLFVFGIIEYGRMVMVQQILTNSAREGARVGILDNSTEAHVETAVNQYLGAGGISGAEITITPNPPSNAVSGDPVSVQVSVGFNQVSWLPSPMYLGRKDAQLHRDDAARDESVTVV